MNRELLRRGKAAKLVGGRKALDEAIQAGDIVPVRCAGEYRFVYSDLVAWQEGHRVVVNRARSTHRRTNTERRVRLKIFREELAQNARQDA